MGKTSGNYYELWKKHEKFKTRYEALLSRAYELERELAKKDMKKNYNQIIENLIDECDEHERKVFELQSKITEIRKRAMQFVELGAIDYDTISQIFGEKQKSFLDELFELKKKSKNSFYL